jgi:endonuclease-3 related protein
MLKLSRVPISNKVYQLYRKLYQKHGSPRKFWPQWCATRKSLKTRETIAIGAILTQRTSWHNADLALRNLKKAGLLSLERIAKLTDFGQLGDLIRSAGFYQTKPQRLFDFCSFVMREYGSLKNFMKENLEVARERLLALGGIGPETADTILLYVLDKPSFVIDEYTKRLVKKRKLAIKFDYNCLKNLFEENLPRSFKVYQDFHALIIIEEKGRAGSAMKKV